MNRNGKEIRIKCKIPNRKKKLITYEFLKYLKLEHDKEFIMDEDNEESYYGWYSWFIGTKKFDEILEKSSKKFNIYNAIYMYTKSLSLEEYYDFLESMVYLMVQMNIIEEGNKDSDVFSGDKVLVKKMYKGYTVFAYEVV